MTESRLNRHQRVNDILLWTLERKLLAWFCKRMPALLSICLLPAFAAASSLVTAKVGSGTGSVSPGKAIIPTGGSRNFIIATSNGVIKYVTLDNMIVTVFRIGGIGKPSAIITIPENGKPRRLYVYFSSSGADAARQPGMVQQQDVP